jgi:peptidoglycan/LPS O-acetylase OafA/YrhL
LETINNELTKVAFFARELPFFVWSAAVFYAALLAVCVAPPLRRRFLAVFEAPNPSTHSQIAPLDTFRGMAAMWVVAYHTWITTQPFNDGMLAAPCVRYGQMAVPIFAVLSGLLVYRSLRNRIAGPADISKYFRRRFLRIYPLYIITLVVSIGIGLLIGKGLWGDGKLGLFADAFMLRVFGFPDFLGTPPWNTPAWSLNVEVLFYIALPLLVIAAGRRIVWTSVVGLLIFSAVGTTGVMKPFLLMKCFFIGILICEVIEAEYFKKINGVAAFVLFAAGAVMLGLNCAGMPVLDISLNYIGSRAGMGPSPFSNIEFSVTAGVAAAFMFVGAAVCMPVNRLLSAYPLRFFGIISYSIYLWHSILIRAPFLGSVDFKNTAGRGDWFTFILIITPAILLYASLSYVLIEKPFLNLRPKK